MKQSTFNQIILIIVVIVLSFVCYYNHQTINDFSSEGDVIYHNYQGCEYEEIAEKVKDIKPYERNVWDCSDMTDKLVIDLRKRGYNAEYISGYMKNKNGTMIPHAWTRLTLDIESTSARVLSKFELKDRYKEKNYYEKGSI